MGAQTSGREFRTPVSPTCGRQARRATGAFRPRTLNTRRTTPAVPASVAQQHAHEKHRSCATGNRNNNGTAATNERAQRHRPSLRASRPRWAPRVIPPRQPPWQQLTDHAWTARQFIRRGGVVSKLRDKRESVCVCEHTRRTRGY